MPKRWARTCRSGAFGGRKYERHPHVGPDPAAPTSGSPDAVDGCRRSEDYVDIKDQVLAKVRHRNPVATEGADRDDEALDGMAGGDSSVIEELRRIRELLEAGRTAD